MTPLDLSASKHLPMLMELAGSLSQALTPNDVLRIFSAGRHRMNTAVEPYASVSIRNLPEGAYKLTRTLSSAEMGNLNALTWTNPWSEWESIPTHTGGVLGPIIRDRQPVVLHHLDLTTDPALGPKFADCRSIMALPLFDGGKPLNWAIMLSLEPQTFTLADVEERILQANLVGGTVRQVLTAERLREASLHIAHELKRIAAIQQALVPAELPTIPGLTLAASYRTFDEAGGDLYSIVPLTAANGEVGPASADADDDGDLWAMIVADASGHGPSAAVVMAMLHAIIHAIPYAEGGPSHALRRINTQLCDKRIEQSFVTAFLSGYFTRSRKFVYCRAGHNPPLLMTRSGGAWDFARVDAVGDLPLGIMPDVDYQTAETRLDPGQTLVMYTDGITEAMSPSRELFGETRLMEVLSRTDGRPQSVIKAIESAVGSHQSTARASDDQTLLVVRVEEDA